MNEYAFDDFLENCSEYNEATHCIEIFNYSDHTCNTYDVCELFDNSIKDFLRRRHAFSPALALNRNVKLLSGLRMIVQMNVTHFDTHEERLVTLPKSRYREMFNTFHLDKRSIEAGSITGSSFWTAECGDEEDSRLSLVHRNSYVDDEGKTQGWEMTASYSFQTRMTFGYLRGTTNSCLRQALTQLRASPLHISHPLLLPIIFTSCELAPQTTQVHYDARKSLEHIEDAMALHEKMDVEQPIGLEQSSQKPDGLATELMKCYTRTISRRPQAYSVVLDEMEDTLDSFWDVWSIVDTEEMTDAERKDHKEIEKLHKNFISTVHLQQMKLQRLEDFASNTLDRIKILRKAVEAQASRRDRHFSIRMAMHERCIQSVDQIRREIRGPGFPAGFGSSNLPTILMTLMTFFTLFFRQNNVSPTEADGTSPVRNWNEQVTTVEFTEDVNAGNGDSLTYTLASIPMVVFIAILYMSSKKTENRLVLPGSNLSTEIKEKQEEHLLEEKSLLNEGHLLEDKPPSGGFLLEEKPHLDWEPLEVDPLKEKEPMAIVVGSWAGWD